MKVAHWVGMKVGSLEYQKVFHWVYLKVEYWDNQSADYLGSKKATLKAQQKEVM